MFASRKAITLLCLGIMVFPTLAMAAPVSIAQDSSEEVGWWVDTTVDRNGNGIGDMIEVHKDSPLFLDEDNTLPLIVDFDHTPGAAEVALLEREIEFQHQWTLEGIDELNNQFSKSNLKFLNRVDITENVIEGLNKLSEYRENHIQKSVPFLIRSLFKTYAGIKGTEIYNSFITGKMIYSFALLKK